MKRNASLSADSNALYSPPGQLLFVRDGTLLHQSFNASTLELSGEATPIAGQVAVSNGLGAFSASETGVLAYRGGPGTSDNVQLAWFDRTGKLVETLGATGPYRGVDVSRDGKHIAVHRHDGTGANLDDGVGSARDDVAVHFRCRTGQRDAVWSPDGSRIVFGSLRNGKWACMRRLPTGLAVKQLLVESELPTMPMSWSPDGRFLVYWVMSPKTGGDLWVMSLTGDKKPSPLLQTPFNECTRADLAERQVDRLYIQRNPKAGNLRPAVSERGWSLADLRQRWDLRTLAARRDGALLHDRDLVGETDVSEGQPGRADVRVRRADRTLRFGIRQFHTRFVLSHLRRVAGRPTIPHPSPRGRRRGRGDTSHSGRQLDGRRGAVTSPRL